MCILIYFTQSVPDWCVSYCFCSLQRHNTEKFLQNIPRKKLLGHSTNSYIRLFTWENYIFPRSVFHFCCRKIGGPTMGIHRSLTDTWMWKLGLKPRNSFSENTKIEISLQCLNFSSHVYSIPWRYIPGQSIPGMKRPLDDTTSHESSIYLSIIRHIPILKLLDSRV